VVLTQAITDHQIQREREREKVVQREIIDPQQAT
jgi:hypothetical protein